MTTNLQGIELKELETRYKKSKETIVDIQESILKIVSTSLRELSVKPGLENSADFVDKIVEHTTKIPQELKNSPLAKKLEKELKEFVALENELKTRRKDLFDTLNIEDIDLGSLSFIRDFLERKKKGTVSETYEESNRTGNNKKITDVTQIENDTALRHLFGHFLSNRAIKHLQDAGVETYGVLVTVYNDRGPEGLLKFRHFGKKSLSEVEDLLRKHGDL